MSLQNIRDGLITTLIASASIASTEVSGSDYGILETTSGCAFIVIPAGLSNEPITFGTPRNKLVTWELEVGAYIKDTGNPLTTLSHLWAVADVVKAAIDADDTLNNTCKKAKLSAGTMPRDRWGGPVGIDIGPGWYFWFFTVLAEEWG